MPRFIVTCRAVIDPGLIDNLSAQGVYMAEGAPTQHGSNRHRHHLVVKADDGDDALRRAREMVEAAGVDASDLTLIGPTGDQ